MAPKTITVVDASNSERKKRLSNEDGYRNLLSEFRVACLKDGDGVEIEDFESLLDGNKYTLGPWQQQLHQEQAVMHGTEVMRSLVKQVWYSVLRIQNSESEELATALVFDVHSDQRGPYMLLLLNKHFESKENELIKLYYVDNEGEYFLVEQFKRKELTVYTDGGELDFMIYKYKLDPNVWDVQEGKAERRDGAPPANKKPRLHRTAAPVPMKRAAIICKTPPYSSQLQRSMPVRIFGFPQTVEGRWEGNTTITSVAQHHFCVQLLSAPGLSGGAVITSSMGEVVGFVGGAYDAHEDGKDIRFESYVIPTFALPKRPSSNPSSPDSFTIRIVSQRYDESTDAVLEKLCHASHVHIDIAVPSRSTGEEAQNRRCYDFF